MEGKYHCASCIHDPPKYDLARSLMIFDHCSKNLIYNFKYKDKTDYSKFFANLLFKRYKSLIQDVDFITAVPMHRVKRIIRQYNPTYILAIELYKLAHKPLIYDAFQNKKIYKYQNWIYKTHM